MRRTRDKLTAVEARLAAAEAALSLKADAAETAAAHAAARDAKTAAAKALETVHEHGETFRGHLADLRRDVQAHQHAPAPEPEPKKNGKTPTSPATAGKDEK